MAQPRDCHSSQHTPAFAGLRGKASTVQIVLSALRHELGRSNRRAFSSPACPAPDFNPPLPGWARRPAWKPSAGEVVNVREVVGEFRNVSG